MNGVQVAERDTKVQEGEKFAVRCPQCGRLLFLASCLLYWPGLVIEIKCSRCGEIIIWPVLTATAEVKCD